MASLSGFISVVFIFICVCVCLMCSVAELVEFQEMAMKDRAVDSRGSFAPERCSLQKLEVVRLKSAARRIQQLWREGLEPFIDQKPLTGFSYKTISYKLMQILPLTDQLFSALSWTEGVSHPSSHTQLLLYNQEIAAEPLVWRQMLIILTQFRSVQSRWLSKHHRENTVHSWTQEV